MISPNHVPLHQLQFLACRQIAALGIGHLALEVPEEPRKIAQVARVFAMQMEAAVQIATDPRCRAATYHDMQHVTARPLATLRELIRECEILQREGARS